MGFLSVLDYYTNYYTALAGRQAQAAAASNPLVLAATPTGSILSPYANASTSFAPESPDFSTGEQYTLVLQTPPSATPQPLPSNSSPYSGSKIASLTFAPMLGSSNGFVQRITYSFSARQNVHQTMAGFFLDEFGTAPGRIDLDMLGIVAPGSKFDSDFAFDQFTQLLYRAKANDPTYSGAAPHNPTPPLELLFLDLGRGWTFKITQDNLSISRVVDSPFTARITMSATILVDYQQPMVGSAPASFAQPNANNALATTVTSALTVA